MLVRLTVRMTSELGAVRWAFNSRGWDPTEHDWEAMASGLSDREKADVGKFVFKKDAKSAMIGRFLTKKFISEASGIGWKGITIYRDSSHGKPYFKHELYHGPDIEFNISHSGSYVVLVGAVGAGSLGVDLMRVEGQRTTSVAEFFRLMAKQFSAEEWAVVRAQPSDASRMAMFYRFWCLKESYTKATGTGITVDLQAISFRLSTLRLAGGGVVDDTQVLVRGEAQPGWRFEESMLDEEHIVTIAARGSLECLGPRRGFRMLSCAELVSCQEQVSEPDVAYARAFLAKKQKPS